jgi:hypothetical protein
MELLEAVQIRRAPIENADPMQEQLL